ncbi:hypothetical protein ACWGAN_17980 [Streptomyces sp. NPDC054945]
MHRDPPRQRVQACGEFPQRTERVRPQGQDRGEEFEQHTPQPVDSWARAEERLPDGDLEGGIRDAADAVANIARLLSEGAEFIPNDHDAHATVRVEITRLEVGAERLRKIAPIAQNASE